MQNKLPNVWIHKENIFMFEKRDFENEIEYVPKEKLDVAVAALKEIANRDFRGNRPHECVIAYNVLKEIGEL